MTEEEKSDESTSTASAETDNTPAAPQEKAPEKAVETAPEEASEKAAEKTPQKPASPVQSAPAKRGTGAIAWLGLLLSLAALGVAGWLYQQSLQQDSSSLEVAQEARELAADTAQRLQTGLAESRRQGEAQISTQLAQLERRQQEQLQVLQSALQNQRQQLLELRHTDRSDWALAEAEYLIRLAHQRLLMASDGRSALALLRSADAIILELDDADLHPVRAALAADMAALRGVAEVDVEGTWLRLRALTGEIDKLMLFSLPEMQVAESSVPTDAAWDARLEQGLRAAADRLSSYIIIRRRETPYEPLMAPQWEGLVRQNLRMLLEQAQTALLSGNEELYRRSLAASRRWVAEFFAFNETAVAALDTELGDLSSIEISRQYPDIGGSMSAVKTAIDLRHADGAVVGQN